MMDVGVYCDYSCYQHHDFHAEASRKYTSAVVNLYANFNSNTKYVEKIIHLSYALKITSNCQIKQKVEAEKSLTILKVILTMHSENCIKGLRIKPLKLRLQKKHRVCNQLKPHYKDTIKG